MSLTQVYKNIGTLLSLEGVRKKDGRRVQEEDLSLISKAAIVVSKGVIQWLGPQKKLPKIYAKKSKEIDLQGQTVLPGFNEAHTHSIFSGSRAQEFELRNQGVSYQEIAARGGGILSTMTKTRAANAKSLLNLTQQRTDRFLQQGVTTLEVKTGYALNLKDEIKCLGVISQLKGPRIVSTYLGAHAVPKEFSSADEYLHYILEKVLPVIQKKKLSQRVDIFIEKGFFTQEQARHYLSTAQKMGFDCVIHADQLSLCGGAELAVEMSALSGDHLIQIQENQIQKLAQSRVTALLLPAADLYMKCAYPPARKLIDAGARVALATDFNPGSCPTQDLSLVGLLGRLEMKMTLPEVIAAYTYNAACALKLEQKTGTIGVGFCADFISIQKDWTDLFYQIGDQNSSKSVCSGRIFDFS